MFELNVMSGVRLSRALLPGMLERNWGRIVFIASDQSAKPNPRHGALRDVEGRAGLDRARASPSSPGARASRSTARSSRRPGRKAWRRSSAKIAPGLGKTVDEMRTAYFETTGAIFAPAALGNAGGDRRADRVPVLGARLRHQRRGAARGRRDHPLAVLERTTSPCCLPSSILSTREGKSHSERDCDGGIDYRISHNCSASARAAASWQVACAPG